MQLGFVGTGTMGKPMARCLLEAGHHLTVHDLRREATTELCAAGARWADTPRAVDVLQRAQAQGWGQQGFPIVARILEAMAGVELRAPASKHDVRYQAEDPRRG